MSAYRVVQEGLTNVVRHAPGARAGVTVTATPEGVTVEVVDDGDRSAGSAGEARDGAEAVRLSARLRPDVVLMDVRMPTMDGLDATARIAAANPSGDRPPPTRASTP